MSDFTLDPRLKNDCHLLGSLGLSHLLLVNNALLPWFILVPNTTEIELTDLSPQDQATLLEEINRVSRFIKANFEISKLNIAAIGNIVSQLHIHLVGRDPADYCWPNVVWGTTEREPYTSERLNEITTALTTQLGDLFSNT
ncbi:MAG: HIT family protein [Gammaproteobacteria bacterium]|nr:HIT family protein [Gammaproteobacteria bacterium]